MNKRIFEAIERILKKKKEKVIFDVIIKDYDKSNFYIALVFSKRIEKFKVLFVPVDVADVKNVEEYFCYQFINMGTVNYFLETLSKAKDIYKEESFRNKLSKTMDAYYIEINVHVDGDYKFLTNQIIPQEWDFMFDIIVSLFEHLPNVVSELCNKILALFNDYFDHIKYDYSLEIDISKDNLGLFSENEMKQAEKMLAKVEFAEKIGDKYICIIDDNIFIFAIDAYKNIFNIYIEDKFVNKEYLYVLYLIYKNNIEKKFTKIIANNKRLLCYKIDKDEMYVISDNKKQKIKIKDLADKKIKIVDGDEEFNKLLEVSLKEKTN